MSSVASRLLSPRLFLKSSCGASAFRHPVCVQPSAYLPSFNDRSRTSCGTHQQHKRNGTKGKAEGISKSSPCSTGRCQQPKVISTALGANPGVPRTAPGRSTVITNNPMSAASMWSPGSTGSTWSLGSTKSTGAARSTSLAGSTLTKHSVEARFIHTRAAMSIDAGSTGERNQTGKPEAASTELVEGERDAEEEDEAFGDDEEGVDDEEEEAEELVELHQLDGELAFSSEVEAELENIIGRSDRDVELEAEEEEEDNTQPGDGLDGGGVALGGAPWADQVLGMAEGLLRDPKHADQGLALFGFRAYSEQRMVKIRLEKLTDKWGSPSIDELESFLSDLYALVLKAEERQDLPEDIDIEVSTPGAERVLRVPQDLARFAHSPMYVCYNDPDSEKQGQLWVRHEVYELVEVDVEGDAVIWKLADVRVNRELLGKGRRLSKKQREQRITTPFIDIQVVRLYMDV